MQISPVTLIRRLVKTLKKYGCSKDTASHLSMRLNRCCQRRSFFSALFTWHVSGWGDDASISLRYKTMDSVSTMVYRCRYWVSTLVYRSMHWVSTLVYKTHTGTVQSLRFVKRLLKNNSLFHWEITFPRCDPRPLCVPVHVPHPPLCAYPVPTLHWLDIKWSFPVIVCSVITIDNHSFVTALRNILQNYFWVTRTFVSCMTLRRIVSMTTLIP